jgi:biotin transport system substrate-specific component
MQTNAQSRALAVAVWPERINRAVLAVLLVLAGTAILAISAKIKVPFYPVPMTLQTLAVLLIAATYGSRLAVATVVVYIAEGMLGLPVFTNTPPAIAGPAYMLGPTGGFIVSWIAVAAIVGSAADRGWDRSIPRLAAAMLIAIVVQFAIGFAWFAWFATLSPGLLELLGVPEGTRGAGASFAWAQGVAPFILGDLLKVALAALAVPAAWNLVDRRI